MKKAKEISDLRKEKGKAHLNSSQSNEIIEGLEVKAKELLNKNETLNQRVLKSQEDNVKLKSERDRMNNRIYELQEERDNFAYKEKDCQQQITILNNRM